jgi:hypothetical protein
VVIRVLVVVIGTAPKNTGGKINKKIRQFAK